MKHSIWHILSNDSRSRAEQARVIFTLGHHAEVYDDLAELLRRSPSQGIVLAAETGEAGGPRCLIGAMSACGIWLPVVMTAQVIELDHVVAAMSAGALDYLSLPLDPAMVSHRIAAIMKAAGPYAERRRSQVQAAGRLTQLSPREYQVLELLCQGQSNKDIARSLQISPRTVEIHRANMMNKIGVSHTAGAVNAWLSAQSGQNLAIPARA